MSAVGLPAPDITVSRLDGDLEIMYKAEVIVSGSTATAIVLLSNPVVTESGWYVIEASNEYGVNTTSAYLDFTTGTNTIDNLSNKNKLTNYKLAN